jgi:hypothetical protein
LVIATLCERPFVVSVVRNPHFLSIGGNSTCEVAPVFKVAEQIKGIAKPRTIPCRPPQIGCRVTVGKAYPMVAVVAGGIGAV